MTESRYQVLVHAVGRTDIGAVRQTNQDAYVIADLTTGRCGVDASGGWFEVGNRGVLFAVSDGMGGAPAGDVASALVVEALREHLDGDCKAAEIAESVKSAVEKTNRDVWEAAKDTERAGMGATLVAVVVHRALAHIASVGDSRAYIIRNRRIRRMTKDQSYVELLVDAGAITREEAERSPLRNVILQAMGKGPDLTVALGRLAMRRGDRFLLCSDGLSGKVSDEEMLDVVTDGTSCEEACSRLVELANTRGGDDNITVIIAEVGGDALPAPTPDAEVRQTLDTIQEFESP